MFKTEIQLTAEKNLTTRTLSQILKQVQKPHEKTLGKVNFHD